MQHWVRFLFVFISLSPTVDSIYEFALMKWVKDLWPNVVEQQPHRAIQTVVWLRAVADLMDRVKTKIVQSYSGQICEMVVSALHAFCCFQSSTGNTIYIHCRNILGLNSLTYNERTSYPPYRFAPCTQAEHLDYVWFSFRWMYILQTR